MLVRNHRCCDLNELLLNKSLYDICLCSDQVYFVKESELCRLPCLWIEHDISFTPLGIRRWTLPLLLDFVLVGFVSHKVYLIELLSFLEDAHCGDVLILAHELSVALSGVWYLAFSAEPAHHDSLHVSCFYLEGKYLDCGQQVLDREVLSFAPHSLTFRAPNVAFFLVCVQ